MFDKDIPKSEILDVQRDNFRLPDHTKVLYASGKVREYWTPKISFVSRAWLDMERQKLEEGISDSILVFASKKELVELNRWASKRGFFVVPLESKASNSSYSSFGVGDPDPNSPHSYRCAVVRDKHLMGGWMDAWSDGDDVSVGKLLGYPDCCSEFFDEYWNKQEFRDLTIPAIENGGIDGPNEINILGRWAGYRYVSHMPCSFNCEESLRIAKDTRQAALDAGMNQAVEVMDILLGMPYKYSCLHGIAEITTPIYKVSASSESVPKEYVARREGEQPPMPASGNEFPFENKAKSKITESPSFKRSLDAIGGDEGFSTPEGEKAYSLNGFSSLEAMEKSHAPLVDMAKGHSPVVDLGCGNGILVAKCGGGYGVESSNEAVVWCNINLDDVAAEEGDLFDYDLPDAECAFLMAGRLMEVPEDRARELVDRISETYKILVCYCYGDWDIDPRDEVSKYAEFLEIDSYSNDSVTAYKLQSMKMI